MNNDKAFDILREEMLRVAGSLMLRKPTAPPGIQAYALAVIGLAELRFVAKDEFEFQELLEAMLEMSREMDDFIKGQLRG